MSELKLTSNRYDVEKISNYILSILLTQDGLSFSIRDYLSNQYIHLEYFPELNYLHNFAKIEAVINEHLSHNSTYKEVYLIVDQPHVTFVPNSFAGDQMNQAYFDLNYPLHSDEQLFSFQHKTPEITSVFPIKNTIASYFKNHFPNIKILHVCDVAVWNGLSYHTGVEEYMMTLVNKESFYLLAVREDKLLLNNHFSYANDDDFLFFLLNAFKQLEFDQYKAHIYLSGCVNVDSTLTTKTKRFVKNVEFEDWPLNFNYTDEFFTIPSHRFIHLLIASHCE